MSTKPKFPADIAKAVAKELCALLLPCCELNRDENRPYCVVAGSLRRRKAEVGDLELVYVSQWGEVTQGLLPEDVDLVDHTLDGLIEKGILAKRTNAKGSEMWGPKNKLALHVPTGLPVDFFATRPPFWYNYLVCRTGGADSNKALAAKALERGLAWHPYHSGFSVDHVVRFQAVLETQGVHLSTGPLRPDLLRTGQMIEVRTERDAFALAGLDYLEPWERN